MFFETCCGIIVQLTLLRELYLFAMILLCLMYACVLMTCFHQDTQNGFQEFVSAPIFKDFIA